MEFTTCGCPHPQCTPYGKRGFNAPLVRWELIAAFLACYAPSVRAHFRCARARRPSVYARRSRMTPWRCGPWQKVIPYEVLAVSSMSIRTPSVAGAIEPDDMVGLCLSGCLIPCISPSAKWRHYGASCTRKRRLSPWPSRSWRSLAMPGYGLPSRRSGAWWPICRRQTRPRERQHASRASTSRQLRVYAVLYQ
jgi:hypothetical protein